MGADAVKNGLMTQVYAVKVADGHGAGARIVMAGKASI